MAIKFSKTKLAEGLVPIFEEHYKENEELLNSPLLDENSIREFHQGELERFRAVKQRAETNYVEAMRSDIVFGDEKWSARERFNYQRQQLFSAMCTIHANGILSETIENLKTCIEVTSSPFSIDRNSINESYHQYENEQVDKIVKDGLNLSDRDVERYKRKRNPLRGMKIPGTILTIVGGIFAAIFWVAGLLLLKEKTDMAGYYLGVAVFFTILFIVGFCLLIPVMRFSSARKKYFATHKRESSNIKKALQASSATIVSDYNKKLADLEARINAKRASALAEYRRNYDIFAKIQPMPFETMFPFCRTFSEEKINQLYDYMENGLVDSYTNGLQRYMDEERKALERKEEREYRERMEAMNREHFAKMEGISMMQLESQYRQEEELRRQTEAAEKTAFYAAQAAGQVASIAGYSKRQAEYARRQAKDIARLRQASATDGVGLKVKK